MTGTNVDKKKKNVFFRVEAEQLLPTSEIRADPLLKMQRSSLKTKRQT